MNPYAYKGKNEPSKTFGSEDDYNRALLDECESLGIGLIAITDHWCVDSASGLIEAATSRGIGGLPGFEANSSEGVHLLVIFEAGTPLSDVNAAIGACGASPGAANGTTGNAFKDILEKMSERGALVIPAHANVANSGMLTGRSGTPLVAMVKDPNLHAIGISPGQGDANDQENILKARKPYDRKHPLAVIYADDIAHPDHLKTKGATTWFKVSSGRAESLRLAVRTPETRVALADPAGPPRPRLRQISWTGGFLDGVVVPVSSDLTAIIGGRGTGKSTLIESLRYALDVAPIGKEAVADHKAIVDKVLRSGTIIKVEVETVSPTPHRYTIERVVPNPPIVRDASGTATNQRPADILGSVEIFGQHELAELAGNPESVANMLHRFAGTGGLSDEHSEVLKKLAENLAKLAGAAEAYAELKEELADIPRLEEQVQRFKDTDVAKRLEDQQRLGRDDSTFKEATQRVESASEALTGLSDPQLEVDLVAAYEGVDDSPQKEQLDRATAATTALAARLKEVAVQAQSAIETARSAVAAARSDWEAAVKDQRDGRAEVLRKLHEDGYEPDKYLDTAKALTDLRAKEPRLAGHETTQKTLQTERTALLGQLADHERQQLEALHEAVRAANEATGGVVVVKPIPSPDRGGIQAVITRTARLVLVRR